MRDWLQLIDGEYYRAMRLLLVRAELEYLRHGNPATAASEPHKNQLGTSSPVNSGRQSLAQKERQSL
jgi:hypothetical protein